MKALHLIAFALLVIGGLNWGLTAFGYNIVNMLLSNWPAAEKIVYILVGLSALYIGVTHKSDCKTCSMGTTA